MYQASGSIKIDTRNINLGELSLFEEKGRTKGVTSIDFLTEVEMFKSKYLKQLAFKNLDFDISYYKVGKIKTTELYRKTPVLVKDFSLKKEAENKIFYLKYVEPGKFLYSRFKDVFPDYNHVGFGESFYYNGLTATLEKNRLAGAGELKVGDVFGLRFNTLKALCGAVNESSYFVRMLDKKILIVNLYYQHEVPEKAANFVNSVMESYIESCREKQRNDARATLDFIDAQLTDVKIKLRSSEGKLAKFKAGKDIMNIKQETDATLKEIMQLKFEKVKYDIQQLELQRVYDLLADGKDLRDFAPNFESLNDPLFRETFLKAMNYELMKQDLLLKFTEKSEEVQTIIKKINNMRTFIHESVKNALDIVNIRQDEIEKRINNMSVKVQEFPAKQQAMTMLEREVKLNEQLYNSMVEKRMEIAIAKSGNTVFHEIIDPAEVSSAPVSPNKSLFYGVGVFFALLFGIILSFLQHFFTAKIKRKNDVVKLFSAPVIGALSQAGKDKQDQMNVLGNLYTNLELLIGKSKNAGEGKVVLLTSMLHGEGKTFTTVNLAKLYAASGKKVLIIDMDVSNPAIHKRLDIENERGLSALLRNDIAPEETIVKTDIAHIDVIPTGNIENIFSGILFAPQSNAYINDLRKEYEIILIDAPAIGLVEDAVLMMKQTDYNLFIFRGKKTKLKTAKAAEKKMKEFDVPNLYAVFNSRKKIEKIRYYNSISISRRIWDAAISCF